ncbi:N-acetyltransferase [Bifidobacterium aemilianum]|uniref:N-acetyltransferase n=1 Tax=Bifidobacterium aemilianum TaxID=2493120 RepID=UPI00191BDC60|nr:N-acetyltransferase [Bifidobacterium aemilianum]
MQRFEPTDRWLRHANMDDFETVCGVYDYARRLMAEQGNSRQWGSCYPEPEVIRADIEGGHTIVLVDNAARLAEPPEHAVYPAPELEERIGGNERVIGLLALFEGKDEYYAHITGAWLDEDPYVTAHRVASSGVAKGASADMLGWLQRHFDNIRVDTGYNNHAMQHVLERQGFTACGEITMPERPNDDIELARIGYQWHPHRRSGLPEFRR